jgi:hypothetical protein
MPNILFRGARIRYADLRTEEAGVYARLHLQSDLSGPVQEAMGWGEIPEGVSSAKLTGKLSGHHLVLTPNDKALRQHEIQMACGDISDFALVPEKNEDGEVDGFRLNLIARTNEVGAIAKVEAYQRVCGGCDAALKVSYQSQAQLELGEAAEESDEDEAEETPLDDEPETRDSAPLPSSVQMAGNMDKLKKQRRARQPKGGPLPMDAGAPEWGGSAEVV